MLHVVAIEYGLTLLRIAVCLMQFRLNEKESQLRQPKSSFLDKVSRRKAKLVHCTDRTRCSRFANTPFSISHPLEPRMKEEMNDAKKNSTHMRADFFWLNPHKRYNCAKQESWCNSESRETPDSVVSRATHQVKRMHPFLRKRLLFVLKSTLDAK